jgi:hypothetical protein
MASRFKNVRDLKRPEIRAELLKDLFAGYGQNTQGVVGFGTQVSVNLSRFAQALATQLKARAEIRKAA